MATRLRTVYGLLALLITPSFVLAVDGATPVWEQTTITESGNYVLTRDIEVSEGTAILVDADDVTLDLNNFTVRSSDPASAVITVATDRDGFLVHSGSVRGGSTGVLSEGTTYSSKIRIRDLTISGQQGDGILVNKPRYVEVVGCRVGPTENGSGIFVSTDSAFAGRIVENYVLDPGDSGIRLYHLKQGEVVKNIVQRERQNDFGILLTSCEASRIDGNKVSAELPSGYSGMTLECNSSVIARNTSTGHGAYGIGITGHGNRVFENEVSYNLDHGFFIGGSNNLLTENTAHGNGGRGIFFIDSNGHAYSNNMLRGNSAPVGGGPATDAGGNIF